jgi:hypothetical protein
MNGREIAHLLATLAVWPLVISAYLLLVAATITPPGFLLDPMLLAFALGPAGLLILPAALLWYKGKDDRHPYLWRYAGMGALIVGAWGGAYEEFATSPLYVPLLIEAVCALGTFGIWYAFERGWILGEYRGTPTDPAGLHRGTQVLDARSPPATLWGENRRTGEGRPVEVGGARIPRSVENRSFLVAGAPGTGKSVAIGGILEVVRARGERAIVYDPTGEYLSVFYRAGDTILNPLDARSASWTPWEDAPLGLPDYERMAEALIPENVEQPFWHQAGRALLAAVLAEAGEARSVEMATRLIQAASDEELRAVVERYGMAGLVGGPQTFANVRAAMAVPTTSLRYLRDGGRPFGLREWAGAGRGWLWLTSRADQQPVLKPLISLWVDLAVTGVLVQPPSQRTRVWLVLDELPTLQRLPALEPALAGGRKFELSSVLGLQSIAQLRVSYGRDVAEAILGQPQTQFILRLPDPETARWASGAIGERHIVREVKGESHGDRGPANRTTSWQHQIEAAVLPSQVQALPKLEGYLRVADSPEVRRIRLTPTTRPVVAEAFVPLSGGPNPPSTSRKVTFGPASGPVPGRSIPSLSVRHPDLPEFG